MKAPWFQAVESLGPWFLCFCWLQLPGTIEAGELNLADFNNQGPFNCLSGDHGTLASKGATIVTAFDTSVFHGSNGAALRIDYSVPTGFCGIWHSLQGKASFPAYTLNFTNLYGRLRNSAANPSRVENVRVTRFSFWARGDGHGDFTHKLKVEFKSPQAELTNAVFDIPNGTNWIRLNFAFDAASMADLSRVKEVVFVIEDWRNANRTGRLYLDDLSFGTDAPTYDPRGWNDDALLDVIEQRAFSYFLTYVDDMGFALDRSTYSDIVSVGAVGFQLTAYCIGHRRGWADRNELERRVTTILRNLRGLPMGPETGVSRSGYRGFYYHFLAADTGKRKDKRVELSLYDTMLLMYGVLSCREYFTNNAEIQTLSRELFDRVEWDWFVDRALGDNANRFHLSWTPGPTVAGTFHDHVDGQTDEALLVDILALGSGSHPVSLESYLARNRVLGSYPPGRQSSIMVSWQGSLFNYFFANCWLDLRERGLELHPVIPRDIWENDRLAILANRQFCLNHATSRTGPGNGHYATYGEGAWGLTACDNLVGPGSGLGSEYFAFGALPNEQNIRFRTRAPHAGTIAVYGAASTINFVPDPALAAIRYDFNVPGLWSPLLGFGDAFSLDPHYVGSPYDREGNPTVRKADYLNGPWINHTVMGINVGPMLLAIENHRSRLVWDAMARNPEIETGLQRIFGLGPPPELAIAVERKSVDEDVILRWKAKPGAAKYVIYSSTDLATWKLEQNGVMGTSWTGPGPKHGSRFYRVKAER